MPDDDALADLAGIINHWRHHYLRARDAAAAEGKAEAENVVAIRQSSIA